MKKLYHRTILSPSGIMLCFFHFHSQPAIYSCSVKAAFGTVPDNTVCPRVSPATKRRASTAYKNSGIEANDMKVLTKQVIDIGLLVLTSLTTSTLIMHFGLISSRFSLPPIIIAALTGGFLSSCLVSCFCRKEFSLHASWHMLLTGTMTAFIPILFIVCAMSLHDALPQDSCLNKLLERYDDKISPLHE